MRHRADVNRLEHNSTATGCVRAVCSFTCLILVFATAQRLSAQGNASVVGVVSDSSGAAIPGATVTITNEGTSFQQHDTTDSMGRYNFPRLSIGNFSIDVVGSGFKKTSQTGVNLTRRTGLNHQLHSRGRSSKRKGRSNWCGNRYRDRDLDRADRNQSSISRGLAAEWT